MKFIANASFLAALVATAMGPSSTQAIKLSSPGKETAKFETDITFKTDHEIVDTPESLAIFEQAVLMASQEAHDPDTYHLSTETVESASHTRLQSRAAILGEVKTAKKEEEGKKDGLRGAVAGDDDDDDALFWAYGNDYYSYNERDCHTCRRTAAANLMLGAGAATPASAEDDDESHKKWEQDLCDILGQTEIYAGAYDCKIEFIENVENMGKVSE
jgi:hypothetical protein